jgi:hypothetical protein
VVRRQWPLLVVLSVAAVGLLLVAFDGFRVGSGLLGFAVLLAGTARALLPARRVGLLAVRGRSFDVLLLLVMGVALVVLAVVVPGPRQ